MVDLQEILNSVIEKYGKNEGYAIPEIVWSENNMLSSFGMYQFWNNRIVVSNLLNTDKVSEEAVASVVFHEYTHQLYKDHNADFIKRMKKFNGYSKHEKALEDYLSSLQEVQSVKKHDLQLNENEELIFCYLPYDPKNQDSYWNHIGYIDHYNIGFLPNRITKEFVERPLKQVVWLVHHDGADYFAGWCKNAYIYKKKQIIDLTQFGLGAIDYKFRYPVSMGKLLLPQSVQFALDEGEIPDTLKEYGICKGEDIEPGILHEVCNDINNYPLDFLYIGLSEDAIDCIPGIEITDVGKLIEMSQHEGNLGNRAIWILNKAVNMEQSYRTYYARAMAFLELPIFDRAVKDFEQALKFPYRQSDGCNDETWVKRIIESIKKSDKLFG